MNFKKITIITITILFIMFTIMTAVSAADVQRSPRFNLRGITGDDFIGQAGILYPFRNKEDSLWYTDFRYRISDDDADEWNLGIGYRYKLDNVDDHIAGVYLFRDKREEYDYDWGMWTIGGEILTDQWDLRLNAYISDDDVLSAPELDEVVVKDRRLLYQQGAYASMHGLDFEVGKRFTDTEGIFNDVGIYAKAFRFFESSTETMTGKQLRVDKQFGDRDKTTWKLGLQWRDDNIRGSDTEATFAVSIPFGGSSDLEERAGQNEGYNSEDILEARMTELPERDLDIIVGESDALQSNNDEENTAFDFSGGVRLGTVWYVTADGDSEGDGSREDPIGIANISGTQLAVAESSNSPGENDVIILLGDDGSMELNDATINLQSGQKLLSPGGFLTVAADAEGSRKTQFRPEGERAKLENLSIRSEEVESQRVSGNLIVLADNTTVSGLEINVPGYTGSIIGGSGISGEINVTNNIISGSYSSESIFEENESVVFKDYNAISILLQQDKNADINIAGNEISNFSKGIEVNSPEIQERGVNTNQIDINISDNKLKDIFAVNFIKGDNYILNEFNANAIGIAVDISSNNSNVNISDNELKGIIAANLAPNINENGILVIAEVNADSNAVAKGIDLDVSSDNSTINIANNELENIFAANLIEGDINADVKFNAVAIGIVDINSENSTVNITDNKLENIFAANLIEGDINAPTDLIAVAIGIIDIKSDNSNVNITDNELKEIIAINAIEGDKNNDTSKKDFVADMTSSIPNIFGN
ncbi:inverse autotransporter beta domain-containing protein [Halanaerobium hydrogeniformans]|uniref:Inverse autotransporter beta-domain domain-containing protein n=1 Tax=Halanaerobium hydrogeniformans TaxID=656519 RepID=E4RPP9_HALHG|nr:inverse autotransporter beta-barrel domain-containing protein [Halanaerobium hydrogeniformans]ADQ13933.1 hypothetical protein Halsa_0460 [Halanaerobium hydrogeniformans]